MTGFPLTSLIP